MKYFIFFLNFIKKKLLTPILSLCFPNFCWNCATLLRYNSIGYCHDCFQTIENIALSHHCAICCSTFISSHELICSQCLSDSSLLFDQNISCFHYSGYIQNLIHAGKYENRKSVWTFFASQLIICFHQLRLSQNMIIVPVPISKKRLSERGFNQSEILATLLAKSLSLPISLNSLQKIKHNLSQVGLTSQMRLSNPKNCYTLFNQKPIINQSILLIDDVFTTGSTINECSKILKENGALKVISMTIAKSDYHDNGLL